uniref:Putative secreted protein n=1 Tax=Anopheles darlingi TaxID=43151 RepID=A0A2M4D549_ANODA
MAVALSAATTLFACRSRKVGSQFSALPHLVMRSAPSVVAAGGRGGTIILHSETFGAFCRSVVPVLWWSTWHFQFCSLLSLKTRKKVDRSRAGRRHT